VFAETTLLCHHHYSWPLHCSSLAWGLHRLG